MYERDGVTPKVPEVQILVEFRSRRQGGKLYHIIDEGIEIKLTERKAVRMSNSILKIAKEK